MLDASKVKPSSKENPADEDTKPEEPKETEVLDKEMSPIFKEGSKGPLFVLSFQWDHARRRLSEAESTSLLNGGLPTALKNQILFLLVMFKFLPNLTMLRNKQIFTRSGERYLTKPSLKLRLASVKCVLSNHGLFIIFLGTECNSAPAGAHVLPAKAGQAVAGVAAVEPGSSKN